MLLNLKLALDVDVPESVDPETLAASIADALSQWRKCPFTILPDKDETEVMFNSASVIDFEVV